MIAGLDSSTARPTPDIITQAYAAGVRLWSGYLATRPAVGLESPWDLASFDVARLLGSTPIGFCSGWDDPAALRTMAAAWNVRLCLDVESGIRGDGPWVDGFLGTSGAGLYGGLSVHAGRQAAFHILPDSPGFDPGMPWPSWLLRPAGPVGWQWIGGHNEFGLDVDRGWYDDWFGGGRDDMSTWIRNQDNGQVAVIDAAGVRFDPAEFNARVAYAAAANIPAYVNLPTADFATAVAGLPDLKTQAAKIAALGAPSADFVNALAAALVPHLQVVNVPQLEADLVANLPAAEAAAVLTAIKAQWAKP